MRAMIEKSRAKMKTTDRIAVLSGDMSVYNAGPFLSGCTLLGFENRKPALNTN
jgi:hypothetical protein